MPINPYLNFAGNCREAVEFYADVFHTDRPRIMTFGEMPGDPEHPLPPEARNMVLHAEIHVAGTSIMFSDVPPGMGMDFSVGNNISLALVTKDRDAITNAFNRLKEGGSVHMDLQETFWSKLYGMVRDKYGVEWQFDLDSGEVFGQP